MCLRMLVCTLLFMQWNTTAAQDVVVMSGSLNKIDQDVYPLMEKQLRQADHVLILGDFIDQRIIRRSYASEIAGFRLILESGVSNIHWVPGREEWGAIRGNAADNLDFLQQEMLELDTNWHVVPKSGCPGPYVIEVSESMTLVVINSNWWLHEGEKPDAADCGLNDQAGFQVELRETLSMYDDTKVFLVSYHPLISYGPHGGYSPASVHFLPPVAGTLYAAYRKFIGGRHDLTNYYYEALREKLQETLTAFPDVTVVSALESSFQYIEQDFTSQLIVGNVSSGGYVRDLTASSSSPGFVMLSVDDSGASARYFAPEKVTAVELTDNILPVPEKEVTSETFPEIVNARATGKLHKDQKRPGLLGKNYRTEWETELQDIPVFDIDREKGGLIIVKQGGGMQTRSLRLEAEDEKQYVLRSIEKFPEKAVPVELRNTLAEEVVADQISASHPYAAFVIPPLADAAGVYHTNPKLVYLPDDPRLGKYREDFGGGLYLFEERPDDDWRDQDSFGNSKNIVSTADVVEKLSNDGDHIIDQELTVRSRLFDIWIGDWDRHDDQWRWARFKPDENNENEIKYYQPIPRDRDQAFFWSDGTLLKASSRRWGQPKFQGFHREIRDVAGLEFNARHFDRTFLTEADRQLWVTTARDLKERLTDEVIEQAVRTFPPEIYELHGREIEEKLKARRDDLVRYADEYYLFLSEVVTITGSDKEDLIDIRRLESGQVEVEVWRIAGKSGEKKYRYYSRTFSPDETREIRVFAFGDDDIINISGESSSGPLIRIIGGKGDDVLNDDSRVGGLRKKTVVYDNPDMTIRSQGEVRRKLSDKGSVNKYDRFAFRFNTTMPLITGGFNPDDGVFIGGGLIATRHGFRKDPYKVRHTFLASVAPKSGSYNLSYQGHYVKVLGQWDLRLKADIFEPSYADFFYGLGNKTDFNREQFENDTQFYRVHYGQWIFETFMSRSFGNGKHTLSFGPTFRSVEIDREDNDEGLRFITLYADYTGRGDDAPIPLFEVTRNYTGLQLEYSLDLRDRAVNPKEGMLFNLELGAVKQLGDEENEYQRIKSDVSVYSTFGGSLRTTLAMRLGAQANFGEYEFYQAARLGGTRDLRGYRKFRWAGRRYFYNNLEARIKVLQFDSFLFPAQAGILLFHDIGRVWETNPEEPIRNPQKATWHRGIGGGLWIEPLNRAVISMDYGVSNDDENAFFVRFGFLF